MKTGYVKTARTGGGSDALDGVLITTPLVSGDFAFVYVANVAYLYLFDSTSAAVAHDPEVINPVGNAGNGRWLLQNLVSSGFTGTSVTSNAISIASKTLTVLPANKAFVIGMSVKIADSAAPETNWMHGEITAYTASSGVLVVNVTTIGGSGTKTAWTVSLSAPFILQTNITGNAATATLATNATNLVTTNWTVLESGGYLYLKYGGVSKGRLDSSGNIIVTGNVSAYGGI